MAFVIAEPCVDVKDKACLEVCPADCIYEGERTLYIHPEECIDCWACEPVCPVEAIYPDSMLPEQWGDYARVNSEFFEIAGAGSPAGASDLKPLGIDHPIIAALPQNYQKGDCDGDI
jgi:NAD-dependent dihydropyrimidine dehydrogenase PreA subunit